MALYTKQDFSPRILSKRWLAMKFRPNMVIHCNCHIKSILGSGLLFREDCAEVEQEVPGDEYIWRMADCNGFRFTKGEGVASLIAVMLCVAAFPPRSLHRSSLLKLLLYTTVPLVVRTSHRYMSKGPLDDLLEVMKSYLTLARRTAACLKEYAALQKSIQSVASAIETTRLLLTRQQSELAVTMSRASSALLGNVPWLRSDVAWEAVEGDPEGDLMKIHHAFLVVQSTLLKHIAMAHYAPPVQAQRVYKNYNERLYWIHKVLVKHLTGELKEKLESLERMYRLLRNIGNVDTSTNKKLGSAVVDNWLYSDVHSDISIASVGLRIATCKCNDLDIFLDSCALNRQQEAVDLNGLSKDIDDILGYITKCMSSLQKSQIKMKKLKAKVERCDKEIMTDENSVGDEEEIVQIEDRDPEVRDEVFYIVNTENNEECQAAPDVTTAPGEKEREATKIVLCELKRKLGKREDLMRERERQALLKTMPELRNNVPDFPRQIKFEDFIEWKGYITKLIKETPKRRLFRSYKIHKSKTNKKYTSKIEKYAQESDIVQPFYKANEKLNFKNRFISISIIGHEAVITIWRKRVKSAEKNDKSKVLDPSEPSDSVSDIESNRNESQQNGDGDLKFSNGELELDSSSESDFDGYRERKLALLKDVRRYRAARKKNYPDKRASIDKSIDKEDESLKPVEYSFGTGMAMASVLQVNNKAKFPSMAQEEVFIGDGEVSNDSGNDDE